MSARKKKYKVKKRFFVIVAVLICILLGTGILFFGGGQNESTMEADYLNAQRGQGWKLMMGSRFYIHNENLYYDDGYYAGGYPPENIGVCTDVVWRGFMDIGVVLRDEVDLDIMNHFKAYDDLIAVRDPNIDFRLVPQLERFFQRNAEVLTNNVDDYLAWQGGDIVTFESSHVAVVSNWRNLWGRPYIIQHGKDPAAEEDRIFAADGMEISGHFRWPLKSE